MIASIHELFKAFSGGQFEPVYTGQFESVKGGQFKSVGGGQFHRFLHQGRNLRKIKAVQSACRIVFLNGLLSEKLKYVNQIQCQ